MTIKYTQVKQSNVADKESESKNKNKPQWPAYLTMFLFILLISMFWFIPPEDVNTYTTSMYVYIYMGVYGIVALLLIVFSVYYFRSSYVSVKRALGSVDQKLSDNKYVHVYRVAVSNKISRERLIRLRNHIMMYVFILLTILVFIVCGKFFSYPRLYFPYYVVVDFVNGPETETITYISDTKYLNTMHPGKNPSVEKYKVYYNYWVNFQTSSGEIITIKTSSSIDEFRTFNNTEISYYPLTKTYIAANPN